MAAVNGSPDVVEDPSAYRYLNVFDGWVESQDSASILIDHAGTLTLDAVDGRYALAGLDLFEQHFSASFAVSPTSPFDPPLRLFDAVPPESAFLSGGWQHSALRANARSFVFTYFTDHTGPRGGLHWVEFELFGGLE